MDVVNLRSNVCQRGEHGEGRVEGSRVVGSYAQSGCHCLLYCETTFNRTIFADSCDTVGNQIMFA